jgi:mono/diheme cytochrome c family protein
MKRSLIWIILSVVLVAAMAACTPTTESEAPSDQSQEVSADTDQEAETDGDEAADTEDADEAEDEPVAAIDAAAIYSARCAGCHGADRTGNNGPSLLPERLTKDSSAYVATITNGSGPMPEFGSKLSAEEIQALVEFLLSEPQ